MLHRIFFLRFAFLTLVFTAAMCMAACGVPAWLTDAGSIIALVGSSFTSIAAFVAGLTGNAALAALLTTVSKWITTVQTGISDLQALITQYQASPSTGLLAEIEAALTDLKTNVQQDFSNLGLPPAVLSVIAGIAALAANTLAEWDLAIQGIKTAPTSTAFKEATARLSAVADALPQAISAYKVNVNKILTTKTGDAQVDAALAKTPHI
jgi:hypothetical protein